jgi:arylsulfatase A-like enzyme
MMKRRNFLKSLGIGITYMVLPTYHLFTSKEKKLNFVFFLVDDMGWRDAVCYGSTFYETPNVDQLASQGMRFTNAYAACPVCSPTRASIMTGKYPTRLDTTDWFGAPQPDTVQRHWTRNKPLLPARYLDHLPLEEVTMAEAFHEAGYATFFAGKWHLGGEGFLPEDQGFEINRGGYHLGWPRGGYFSPYENPKLKDGAEGEYLTDRLTDESLHFLDNIGDKPFLLFLSHYAVHTPLQSKEEFIEKYKEKASRLPSLIGPKFVLEGEREARQVQDHPVYAGMIQSMDESLGRLMDKLEALGIADHTAIIFMSDNGGLSTSEGSPTSNIPLRGGKGWLYEGGIREPMIVKWPKVTQPESVCHEPVISTDFYPTMLEMAGLPLKSSQHVDGLSLVPLLKQKASLPRKALYWHYPHYGNQGGSPGAAIRAGDYKLIEFFEDRHVELYDLRNDIGETNNLANAMPEKVKELLELLHHWQRDVDAKMPAPNPNAKKKD